MDTNCAKFLLQYDQESDQFILARMQITEDTKITEDQSKGQVFVGGNTEEELAQVVLKLRELDPPIYWPSGSQTVDTISIVFCDVEEEEEAIKNVANNFLEGLKNAELLTSVKARKIMTVQIEHTKDLAKDFDKKKKKKKKKGRPIVPNHIRIFSLGKDTNLMEWGSTRDITPEWYITIQLKALDNSKIPYKFLLYYKKNGRCLRIGNNIILQAIQDSTTAMFNPENDVNVPLTKTVTVYYKDVGGEIKEDEKVVQIVDGIDSLKENIKYILQRARVERKALIKTRLLDKFILTPMEREEIARLNAKEQWSVVLQKTRKSVITCICKEIEEAMSEEVLYYHVKDCVYGINLEDLYVHFCGTTEKEKKKIDKHYEKMWTTQDAVAYSAMEGMRNKESFVDMVKKWVQNQHEKIPSINPLDGMAVIATQISEVVRNPKMFLVNRLLWYTDSWEKFSHFNPMVTGGSWSTNHAAIGLDYESDHQEYVTRDIITLMKIWIAKIFSDEYFVLENNQSDENMDPEEAKRNIRATYEKGILKKCF